MGTDLKSENNILIDDELEIIRKFIFNKTLYNNKTLELRQDKTNGFLQIIKSTNLRPDITLIESLVEDLKLDKLGKFQIEQKRIELVFFITITLSAEASWKVIKFCISRATPPPVKPQGATQYTVCKLPKDLYPARTTPGTPDFFLCSNLTEEDNFHIPQSSTESNRLLDSLNSGNYALLQDYFRRGIHPGPLIADLYFRQKNSQVSLDLLDIIYATADAVSELTHDARPDTKISISPIFSPNGDFSYEAEHRLLPYLSNLYPTEREFQPDLKARLRSIPMNEQFFAIIELSNEYFFMALKTVINNCLTDIAKNDTRTLLRRISIAAPLFQVELNPYRDMLLPLVASITCRWPRHILPVISTLSVPDITTILKDVNNCLETDIPSLKYYTEKNYFYSKFVADAIELSATVTCLNNGRVGAAQVIVPGKLLEICHSFFYGEHNHVERFIGFGKFSASDVAAATQLNGRIINDHCLGIGSIESIQGSKQAGPWSVRTNDLEGWRKMISIPIGFRVWFIALARMLAKETGFALSKISYQLYDMNFTDVHFSFEHLNCNNIKLAKLTNFYKVIAKKCHEESINIFEYTLIIIFEMLRDPNLLKRIFSHHSELGSDVNYWVISTLVMLTFFRLASDPKKGERTVKDFIILKNIFDKNYSSTYNVFCYLTAQTALNKELERPEQKLLTILVKKVNVLVWTRNHGLKLSHNGKELFVANIKNDTLNFAFNIILSASTVENRNILLKEITALLPNFQENDQAENSLETQRATVLAENTSDQSITSADSTDSRRNVYKAFATFKMGWFTVRKERLLLYQDLTRKEFGTAEDRLPEPSLYFC